MIHRKKYWLKIQCNIYILMKKVIILRKGQVAMKTFAPPFFNHFSLSLSRKKNCGNEVVVCSQCFLRSSCLQIFFKRGVLKNSQISQENTRVLRRDPSTGIFLWNLRNFEEQSFFLEHLRRLLLKLNICMLQLWIYYILE